MKKYLIVILFLLLNTTIAFSGEIYGTIKKDGKPIAEGSEIKLEMLTSGKTYSSNVHNMDPIHYMCRGKDVAFL